MTDQLELSAWRFIASHRVGGLAVSHAQFIDGDAGCHITAPSSADFYESAAAETFGKAAIKLAIALGMPCLTSKDEARALGSDVVGGKSSASTAILPSGARVKASRRTGAGTAASTTGATGAAADTAVSVGRRQTARKAAP